jgi:hypothetical protein
MGQANKLWHPEIREKLTSSILHLLASLPETDRNIFVWKHYYGWPESQIASRLGWIPADVENTLYEIGRTVIQSAEAILLESARSEETNNPSNGVRVSVGDLDAPKNLSHETCVDQESSFTVFAERRGFVMPEQL